MSQRMRLGFLAVALGMASGAARAESLDSVVNKHVLIENVTTKRLLLSDGKAPEAKEGGWTKSPAVVAADQNYYDRAEWIITPKGEGYVIENATTKRLLLSTGEPAKAKEGGWTKSPPVVAADENYYNRAIWKIVAKGDGFEIENVTTKRLLLSDGKPPEAKEGGWTKSPPVVGADENYYNRAIWKIVAK